MKRLLHYTSFTTTSSHKHLRVSSASTDGGVPLAMVKSVAVQQVVVAKREIIKDFRFCLGSVEENDVDDDACGAVDYESTPELEDGEVEEAEDAKVSDAADAAEALDAADAAEGTGAAKVAKVTSVVSVSPSATRKPVERQQTFRVLIPGVGRGGNRRFQLVEKVS